MIHGLRDHPPTSTLDSETDAHRKRILLLKKALLALHGRAEKSQSRHKLIVQCSAGVISHMLTLHPGWTSTEILWHFASDAHSASVSLRFSRLCAVAAAYVTFQKASVALSNIWHWHHSSAATCQAGDKVFTHFMSIFRCGVAKSTANKSHHPSPSRTIRTSKDYGT